MGCGTSMIKYFLFLFNFLTAIAGIALIVVGAIGITGVKAIVHENHKESLPAINVAGGVIIGLGCVIFIISFLGCCGAIQESNCMTVTYAVFMMLLFLLQLAVIALIYLFKSALKQGLNDVFDSWWKTIANEPEGSEPRKQWYSMQEALKCCGNNGPGDYGILGTANLDKSCCDPANVICTNFLAYSQGCKEIASEKVAQYSNIIGYVSIAIAIFEVISFIFGCTLANHFRNERRRSHY